MALRRHTAWWHRLPEGIGEGGRCAVGLRGDSGWGMLHWDGVWWRIAWPADEIRWWLLGGVLLCIAPLGEGLWRDVLVWSGVLGTWR